MTEKNKTAQRRKIAMQLFETVAKNNLVIAGKTEIQL